VDFLALIDPVAGSPSFGANTPQGCTPVNTAALLANNTPANPHHLSLSDPYSTFIAGPHVGTYYNWYQAYGIEYYGAIGGYATGWFANADGSPRTDVNTAVAYTHTAQLATSDTDPVTGTIINPFGDVVAPQFESIVDRERLTLI
jgi:hypothetical protein